MHVNVEKGGGFDTVETVTVNFNVMTGNPLFNLMESGGNSQSLSRARRPLSSKPEDLSPLVAVMIWFQDYERATLCTEVCPKGT